jgi:RimJ/RimL family protein N-acetyltransferase
MIGRIGLFGFDASRNAAELGIVLGDRSTWGKGYGREAVCALVDEAFANGGLTHILLYTFEGNLRAQRAFAACGFQPVRTVRKFSMDRGAHLEIEMIIRRDWWRRIRAAAGQRAAAS